MAGRLSEGSDPDPWRGHYAARTAGLSASEVRALFAVASRPEVVSLAGGMPFVSALPLDLVTTAVERTLRERGDAALQYGSGQGVPVLREQILEVMALEGIHGRADDVVVTTGSQHALELLAKLFLDPGDIVLAEGPSYVTALVVFRSFQADVSHVTMDEHGVVPEALRERIAALAAEGRKPKLIYTVPTFNNPAGVTLSSRRRVEILQIAREHDILVIEDNPYGLLYFGAPPPDPLRSIADDGIVYLGTFSKTLAPGLRVGWALAPPGIRDKLILANEAAILSPSSFTQLVVSEYLHTADWRAQIATFRGVYQERRDALLAALAEFLPNLTWTVPDGGFYVWLSLPNELDSSAMLPRAVVELVAYTPGSAFYADGNGHHNIRLSFSYPNPEFIREGVRRLAMVIEAETRLAAAGAT
ncbi:MAG: PLP-dependent aminotransferase family protein [Terrimesophilobacter sp.]